MNNQEHEINNTQNDNNTMPEQTEQIQETITTYFDDHETTNAEPMENTKPSTSRTMDVPHSIIEFLERPATINQYSIATTNDLSLTVEPLSNVDKAIFNLPFPSTVIAVPSKSDKLQWFQYLTSDVEITLLINANPLTTGLLMLVYAPYEDVISAKRKLINSGYKTITAYPHVLIDPQKDVSVRLTIPYLGREEAYDLANGEDYASLFLFALTPIRNVDGASPIQVTLQASLQNVILAGPTVHPLATKYVPERVALTRDLSIEQLRKIKSQVQIAECEEDGDATSAKKEVPVKKNVKPKRQGPISQFLNLTSSASKALSVVPTFTAYAMPVYWLSQFLGTVASAYGFSKPQTQAKNVKYTNVPGFGAYHTENVDQSSVLAFNQKTSLSVPNNVFQTNVDEMALEYICNNPAQIDVFPWTTTTPLLRSFAVGPSIAVNNTFYNTPFDYISRLFKFHRATYCFKFLVQKTAFHSGRFEIVFNFKAGDVTATTDTSNLYRAILDITNDTEIIIRIPYIYNRLFLQTGQQLGYLTIRELSPLIASETVEPTVDISVWSWAENVCFVQPESEVFHSPHTPTSRKVTGEVQISLTNKTVTNIVTFFKEEDESKLNLEALKLACGDPVISARTLTRSAQYFALATASANKFNLTPFSYESIISTHLNYLSWIYRMWRGDMYLKITPSTTTQQITSYQSNNAGSPYERSPYHITFSDLNPYHEINVPYFTNLRRQVIGYETDTALNAYTIALQDSNAATKAIVYRSAGDNHSFGWLVGAPATTLGSGAQIPVGMFPNIPTTTVPVETEELYDLTQTTATADLLYTGISPITFNPVTHLTFSYIRDNSGVEVHLYVSFRAPDANYTLEVVDPPLKSTYLVKSGANFELDTVGGGRVIIHNYTPNVVE